jgi:hypothetical protein
MAQQRQAQCCHHLGSRVVIDTHWLATKPARVSPWMPSPRLCAPNPDSQADGTTSLALVRKSITSRKGQDTLKKRRVLRLAR